MKKIIKLGFDKLFSQAFVYGYLETMIIIIFKLGTLDELNLINQNLGDILNILDQKDLEHQYQLMK